MWNPVSMACWQLFSNSPAAQTRGSWVLPVLFPQPEVWEVPVSWFSHTHTVGPALCQTERQLGRPQSKKRGVASRRHLFHDPAQSFPFCFPWTRVSLVYPRPEELLGRLEQVEHPCDPLFRVLQQEGQERSYLPVNV